MRKTVCLIMLLILFYMLRIVRFSIKIKIKPNFPHFLKVKDSLKERKAWHQKLRVKMTVLISRIDWIKYLWSIKNRAQYWILFWLILLSQSWDLFKFIVVIHVKFKIIMYLNKCLSFLRFFSIFAMLEVIKLLLSFSPMKLQTLNHV